MFCSATAGADLGDSRIGAVMTRLPLHSFSERPGLFLGDFGGDLGVAVAFIDLLGVDAPDEGLV